jgi:hypothetical protein
MATRLIDALEQARANANVVRIRAQVATTEATLVVLKAELELAKQNASDAKVES